MKLLVIHNPVSGSYKNVVNVVKKMTTDHQVLWLTTDKDNKYWSEINTWDFERIIVVGGDGTVHQVANYLLKNNIDIPVGIVPAGSANLLAAGFGLAKDVRKSMVTILTGQIKKIDVGLVNKEIYFLVAGGLGYDAQVISQTSRVAKRLFGFGAYSLAVLKNLFNISETNFSLNVDGLEHQHHAKTVFFMNIGQLLGRPLGPDVSPTDGVFTLAIVRPVKLKDYWRLFFKLITQKLSAEDRLNYYTFRRLKISCNEKVLLQLDGEIYNLQQPLEIEVVASRLSLVL